MSIFSVSVSLTGPPKLQYGFWYSYDSTQTQGYMLTLSNFLASYLSLALGLLVGWAVSRLWRIGCAVLFYFSNVPEPSWEESQNNVFIINTKDAIDGCIDSYGMLRSRAKAYRRGRGGRYSLPLGNLNNPPRYRRAKYVLILVMLVAFITVGLKLATPALIALVPLTRLGIVTPRSCGDVYFSPGTTLVEITAETFLRQARWANAAFAVLDRDGYHPVDALGSLPGTGPTAFPEIDKSFANSCPPDVAACSTRHPFTFSGQYTLSARHFGLNIRSPFLLRVSDSCYRPESAILRIDSTELEASTGLPVNENSTAYGAYYGPVTWEDGTTKNFTLAVDLAQATAGSYAIDRAFALENDSSPVPWSPNSTLIQGGDTTLLLYYIGGVLMKNQSSDAIFATGKVTNSSLLPLYYSEKVVIPIICDTKYVFCDVNRSGNNCSNPGGIFTLLSWLEDRQSTTWMDIQKLLAVSLAAPPIYTALSGSTAPLAAQSAAHSIQYAPSNTTAFGELGRLSTAGMVMLASYPQLSATGYWNNIAQAVPFTTQANPDSLCNQVIMESSIATTIPVIPYLVFAIFSVLVVAISYSASFRLSKKIFFASFDRLSNIWALHLPGQLHREATERLRGRSFKLVSTTNRWPDVPYQSGPTIISRKGAEHFSSGNAGLLENRQEGTEEHPLDTFR